MIGPGQRRLTFFLWSPNVSSILLERGKITRLEQGGLAPPRRVPPPLETEKKTGKRQWLI
jgi:hypothetical protein